MENNYYRQKLFLAQVNDKDKILHKVERWEAHEKGILHRGFTAVLQYGGRICLQHRKHKAFDGTWDMTFSSHQIYQNGVLISDNDAILSSLAREWNMGNDDVGKIVPLGKIYYRARDPHSIYTEHEMDYIYIVTVNTVPRPDAEYAYGCEMIAPAQLKKSLTKYHLAPWVEKLAGLL